MSIKDFKILPVKRKFIKAFVEKWHYSGNINGVVTDYCFALFDDRELIGVALFGRMAMANQWKRFSDNADDVTELRRLCCIDDTPKNTESYFIGGCLKWLAKHTKIRVVASYSDLEYGHMGIIYKASNFECLGVQTGAKVIMYNGKKYHDKTIRTYHNGKLKPYAETIKAALETGEAIYVETKGKVAYQYILKRKRTKQSYSSESITKPTLTEFFV